MIVLVTISCTLIVIGLINLFRGNGLEEAEDAVTTIIVGVVLGIILLVFNAGRYTEQVRIERAQAESVDE